MAIIQAVAGREHGTVEDLPGTEPGIGRLEGGKAVAEGQVRETNEWGIVAEMVHYNCLIPPLLYFSVLITS